MHERTGLIFFKIVPVLSGIHILLREDHSDGESCHAALAIRYFHDKFFRGVATKPADIGKFAYIPFPGHEDKTVGWFGDDLPGKLVVIKIEGV